MPKYPIHNRGSTVVQSVLRGMIFPVVREPESQHTDGLGFSQDCPLGFTPKPKWERSAMVKKVHSKHRALD